ncbi:SDR family oxidoreductase [Streptomyces boncukensis]|uniref:NAD-dependent epimerase/dehydratase family protein n=1 Tax=Streptomyces boncukensis TaxID=2711219 RepID=A0A6G4WQY1_9ACTN|nr:SDR family oxidoreductase [Streptomyces boncukensis]NGO66964.1 NAD-dependent epimerase/dehydratase family protein [Streptomyces boncukensis]
MTGGARPGGHRTVLITGASGVIGREVARELADFHVIGTAHSDSRPLPVDETLRCDLAAERLGLGVPEWQRLADRTDVIVHSAALTEWGLPRARYEEVTLRGTERVAELARAAGAPVHQVSTSFVRAIERGTVEEMSPDNVVTPYIWSKWESEKIFAASGIPHTVYRPTNLVGHSRTGASDRPQIVQRLSDWLGRGKAPYYPAHPGNLVDLVALDTTAQAIAHGVRQDALGKLLWLTYGDGAMTVDEAQDILIQHARGRGRELARLEVVDPALLGERDLAEIPAISRQFMRTLIHVSEVTAASGGALPSSWPELTALGVRRVSDRDAFRHSLAFWAREREREREGEGEGAA